MTGPEHYREAERLLAALYQPGAEPNVLVETILAEAQVHATLGLAAATAARLADRYVGDGEHINDWTQATSSFPHQDGGR